MARILAIDFGTKRIGLAVSDALGITAQGLPTLDRTRIAHDLERIGKLIEEYGVERVILGNPIGHGGNPTRMSGRVAEFAEKLRRGLRCPVELWDERLTSVEAGRVLRESGMGIEKRKRAVDRVAVTLLLQSFLDYHANERARSRKSDEQDVRPDSAEDRQRDEGRRRGGDEDIAATGFGPGADE